MLQKPFSREELVRDLERLGLKPAPARALTVLVIDDDPQAVELSSAYLSQLGYEVVAAYGGEEESPRHGRSCRTLSCSTC